MKHYVRIHYSVPDLGGELVNIAELEELSASQCTLLRMIELDPNDAITGAYAEGRVHGQANQPTPTVPHPSSYASFDGITATALTAPEFEALWAEASALFPEL